MKPQELAKRLGIADVTLRKWAGKDFAEFLSPSASVANSARRSFSDQDVRILSWIAQLKEQNLSAAEISTMLNSARATNWRDLPPLSTTASDEIAVVPREAVEERIKALQERFDTQLQAVVKERDELRSRLETSQGENKVLQQRITELTAQEAELRGLLAQYTIGGRRWNAMAIIAITLVVGVVLTVLVLAAGILLSGR